MNRHDQDIMELGLRVKNDIWSENYGPHRDSATRLAIWRRFNKAQEQAWAGPGFTARNDESTS